MLHCHTDLGVFNMMTLEQLSVQLLVNDGGTTGSELSTLAFASIYLHARV